MLQGVDRIIMRVPSVDAAVTYYRDVLKLHLVRREAALAAFSLPPDSELILHSTDDLPASGVYFRVDSVDEVHRQREALQLRFVSNPKPVTRGKLGIVRDPFGNILMLLDRTRQNPQETTIESAGATSGALFSGIEPRLPIRRDALAAIYTQVGRTADDLPYTHHFETLFEQYRSHFDTPPSRTEVWRHLLTARKSSHLPKLGKARSTPPPATDTERNLLIALLSDHIGRRDRLPYTKAFDELVEAFNSATRRRLTPHQIWRLVATLAK
jgi:catechol 2,3-dioxygenase-like lactoylglutathione lyase family enzyme